MARVVSVKQGDRGRRSGEGDCGNESEKEKRNRNHWENKAGSTQGERNWDTRLKTKADAALDR